MGDSLQSALPREGHVLFEGKSPGVLSAYHMKSEKVFLDLSWLEMRTPEKGHRKQMEGEQDNIERIMIWLGSCSDSTPAASRVLSGLEVSLQR